MSAPKQLEYDATVLQEFAKRLYRQADNMVGRWVGIGLFLGLAGSSFLANFLHLHLTGRIGQSAELPYS